MKHNRLLLMLVALGLVLGAVPALASSVYLVQDLALGISAPGLTVVEGSSYTVSTAYAYASGGLTEVGPYYSPDPGYGDPVAAPFPATSTIPANSWIGDTVGSALFVTRDMHAAMSGDAPGDFGSLSQNVFNQIFITFQATAASATVTITPGDQSLTYGVTGQNGSPFFYYLQGYSDLTTTIYSPHNQAIDANYQPLLADLRFDRFGDFGPIGDLATSFYFDLTNLSVGELVTLDIQLSAGYDGLSQVPLPPAVWLFGSGLASLLLVRRRTGNRA